MRKLKSILENNERGWGRVFDLFIQFLIVLSMISFSLETLPNLSPQQQQWLHVVEVVIAIIFSLEYVLRILVADSKKGYIFSFFGIIDLLAILPFYLTMGFDLRVIRAFRFLRLLRSLKLLRHSDALDRLRTAFVIAREEIIVFFLVTLLLLYFSGVGIYYFENPVQPENFSSVFSGLWWAVATLTTVGYGDIYPVTVGGRIFTFLILMIGLGIVAVPTGMLASALAQAREKEDKEDKEAE